MKSVIQPTFFPRVCHIMSLIASLALPLPLSAQNPGPNASRSARA
jgi:hypothetical protein